MSSQVLLSVLLNVLVVFAYKAPPGPIDAAVQSHYHLEVRHVHTRNDPIPVQRVDIESSQVPLVLHFRSHSSKLKVLHTHVNAVGETKRTNSEDEPIVHIHRVHKPVLNQLKEVVLPYTKKVQIVQPVQETVDRIVAKGKTGGTPQGKAKHPKGTTPPYKPSLYSSPIHSDDHHLSLNYIDSFPPYPRTSTRHLPEQYGGSPGGGNSIEFNDADFVPKEVGGNVGYIDGMSEPSNTKVTKRFGLETPQADAYPWETFPQHFPSH